MAAAVDEAEAAFGDLLAEHTGHGAMAWVQPTVRSAMDANTLDQDLSIR